MGSQELIKNIETGRLPVVIYCEKRYEGICCMLNVTRNNKVFLDYDDTYDDAESEGGFRAVFRYESFDKMAEAVERFTNKSLAELTIEPKCYELFDCEKPQWKEFQWELYNGSIKMLDGYSNLNIGSLWWRGLFLKKIRHDSSMEELDAWIKQASE